MSDEPLRRVSWCLIRWRLVRWQLASRALMAAKVAAHGLDTPRVMVRISWFNRSLRDELSPEPFSWRLMIQVAVTHHVFFRWSGTNTEANDKQNKGHSFYCFFFISLLEQMTPISECSFGRGEWKKIFVHSRDYQCTTQLTNIVLLPAAGLLEVRGTCRMKSCCSFWQLRTQTIEYTARRH